MKRNIIALTAFVLSIVLIVGGMYLMFRRINDEIAIRKAQEQAAVTETETEIVCEPVESEITFEPVEITDEIATSETESETTEIALVPETIATPIATEAITEAIEPVPVQVNDDDLMLLARIITNEAGSDWCTNEHQRAVASVVINRVNDDRFPDSIYGVISQGWSGECPIQYAVGSPERFFSLQPSERALSNASYVLEHGSTVAGAIWQAEFIQGEIVAVFEYPYSTTYICK